MEQHRNSQKRYYFEGYLYFITGVTQNRFAYFNEEIFCEVFWENLKLCKQIKEFELHGWFLGYDHFHLLITPKGKANISEIMRSLKTNVSCDLNRIMNPNLEGEVPSPRLQEIYGNRMKFFDIKIQFHQNISILTTFPFPNSNGNGPSMIMSSVMRGILKIT